MFKKEYSMLIDETLVEEFVKFCEDSKIDCKVKTERIMMMRLVTYYTSMKNHDFDKGVNKGLYKVIFVTCSKRKYKKLIKHFELLTICVK